MSTSNKEQSRTLRSKDSNKAPVNKNLFNFDDINNYLYSNNPIHFGRSNNESQLYTYFKSDEETPALRITRVKQVPRKLPKRRTKVDPLPDSKYTIFHRKMKKEETQMLNEEKIKNLIEVDNLNTSLQLLKQYDWVRHLPSITKLNDAMDYEEMERKRVLTISEIEKLLEKQALWKKKRDKFINDTRLFHNGERVIVKEEQFPEKQKTITSLPSELDTTSPHPKLHAPTTFAFDSKVKLDYIGSSDNVNFGTSSNMLFGIDLHDIDPPKNGFQLPLGWRRSMGNKN
ncbi:hypothetical protein KGF57_002383 [Candida theae]|uniref:Something about silencing protein 4 domain-containing protein n=1 Tax=Candida theae TaxID=1198502 RepID=A0AAD5FYS6_9ASCO|nr:uncharacterized protein KGF57_002383 [Candida theae]KAI5958538.1 hypothetical protein KGF57_002383 [Candida theae]